jgi:hypothetical protein
MHPEDESRDRYPAEPGHVTTDDVPAPRTPAEDAAGYPAADPGSPWAPPLNEAGGPPGATGTGGPDGARVEAADEATESPTGSPDDGSVHTDAYHEKATTGPGMGDPRAPGWYPEGEPGTSPTEFDAARPDPASTSEAERDVTDTTEADEDAPAPVATGEGTYASTAAGEPADDLAATREPADEEPAVGVATVPGPDRSYDGSPEPDRDLTEGGPEAEGEPQGEPEAEGELPGEPEPVAEEPVAEEPVAEEPVAEAEAEQPVALPVAVAEREEAEREEAEREEPEPVAEAEAAEAGAEREELAPGEVPAEESFVFWEMETTDGFRDRWQQIQLRFIDSPRNAADQAQNLVNDVMDAMADGLRRQRAELDRWRDAELDDTEELRMTVRRYRNLLDRLLGL